VIFSRDLVPFENHITYITQDFARHYNEFVDAICIFDPQLAHLLQDVQGFKVQSLTAFGALLHKARLAIEFGGLHPFEKVSFSTFDDEIAGINLEEIVEASKFDNGQSGTMPGRSPNKLVGGKRTGSYLNIQDLTLGRKNRIRVNSFSNSRRKMRSVGGWPDT
jgi:hypothetical protein